MLSTVEIDWAGRGVALDVRRPRRARHLKIQQKEVCMHSRRRNGCGTRNPSHSFRDRIWADFSVTVSSNEAPHILIQKSLTQQVLTVISPAGSYLPAGVYLLLQRLG
jgi:hypothetical protein